MPIHSLKRKSAHTTIEVAIDFGDDGDLNLVVYPDRFSIGLQRRLRQAIEDRDVAAMADRFFTVVKSWDLLGEDDKPLPLNEESIDLLSLQMFNTIVEHISEAVTPKKEPVS